MDSILAKNQRRHYQHCACESCQVLQPSQHLEPVLSNDHPTRPFSWCQQTTSVVVFLVIADNHFGWSIIILCGQDTTSATIGQFSHYYHQHDMSITVCLRIIGGLQFTSHLQHSRTMTIAVSGIWYLCYITGSLTLCKGSSEGSRVTHLEDATQNAMILTRISKNNTPTLWMMPNTNLYGFPLFLCARPFCVL